MQARDCGAPRSGPWYWNWIHANILAARHDTQDRIAKKISPEYRSVVVINAPTPHREIDLLQRRQRNLISFGAIWPMPNSPEGSPDLFTKLVSRSVRVSNKTTKTFRQSKN